MPSAGTRFPIAGSVTTINACASREDAMLYRSSIGAIVLTAALCATMAGAQAWDDSKYPDLSGQWVRAEGARGVGRYDPTKPPARGQEAPLTAEYQVIYEANLADRCPGHLGPDPTYRCLSPGMPRI